MSGVIENIEISSTIVSNFVTIIGGIGGILALFYFFGSKKYKAINVSSKTFQIPIEKEDIRTAIRPSKVYDETIDIQYDKDSTSPKEFCKEKTKLLAEIKEKYNPICVFGIAEMFVFIWIGYFLQDSIHIRGFRKLKENITTFWGNPRSWTGFLSLKWRLGIKGRFKSYKNRYQEVSLDKFEGNSVVLILSISYSINAKDVPDEVKALPIIYLSIDKTDPGFLINESQVNTFSKKIKHIMHKLDERLGQQGKIHIFGSLPVPFCIKLGQNIHRNGPECIIYDLDSTKKYIPIISTRDFSI